LVARLDADADELHNDITPSVSALSARGLSGACAVVDLLQSKSSETRLHAERVMEGVMAARSGFRAGHGYPDEIAEDSDRRTTIAIGYSYDGDDASRRLGASRWRAWLEAQTAQPAPTNGTFRRALDTVRSQLETCGLPLDLVITFDGSGKIESWFSNDETRRSDAAYRACVSGAIAAIQVTPPARPSTWVHYP
jgi:hypothetical protein